MATQDLRPHVVAQPGPVGPLPAQPADPARDRRDRLQAQVRGLGRSATSGRSSSRSRSSRCSTSSSARIFRLATISQYYPLALLIGIVLFTFFADATTLGDVLARGTRVACCGKLSFPRLIIPTVGDADGARSRSASTCSSSPAFIAWNEIVPQLDWLLLVPLLLELYVFILGIALILATLFVPLPGHRPGLGARARSCCSTRRRSSTRSASCRRGRGRSRSSTRSRRCCRTSARSCSTEDLAPNRITADEAFGVAGRLLPIAIALADLRRSASALFRREEPWFAERV